MRERASSSTRFAGAITAGVATTALALAVVIGMGGQIAQAMEEKLIFTVIPDAAPIPPEPLANDKQFEMTSDVAPAPEPPLVDVPLFEGDDPPVTIIVTPGPRTEIDPGPVEAKVAPPRALVRVGAKLLPAAPPPYPAADVRKGNEGISRLEVCLDARGGVTSASLSRSSGHASLDQAALKWVREAKFAPAKTDGAPQAVCGHSVDYEWSLKGR